MGRDTGAGAARLERVLWPSARAGSTPVGEGPDGGDGPDDGDGPDAWDEAPDSGGAPRLRSPVARHAADDPSPRGGWRPTGVPTVAALVATVAAVVAAIVLLGGGGGPAEMVVGPEPAAAVAVGPDGPADVDARDVGDIHQAEVAAEIAGAAPVGEPVPSPVAAESSTGAVRPTGSLVVHVDGAVVRPGVVTVPAGSRVSDAVAAAGGVTPEADTRLVNLARVLADGELVVVPVPGEVPVGVGTGAGGAAGSAEGVGGSPGGAGAGAGAGPTALLDLNVADAAALDALPGIGPVLAERIVSHRDEVGPFGTVEDLESVSGIGPAVMASIRDLVTV